MILRATPPRALWTLAADFEESRQFDERRDLAAIARAVDAPLARPWPRFRRWLAVTFRRAA